MRTIAFAVVSMILLACAAPAPSQVLNCQSSERFGTALINVGDSERAVLELRPDREVHLETKYGGSAGYRYDFYKYGRTIQVYVESGVVVRICRVPD